MNLKFETIVQIFRKIIELNAVIIWESANKYYRKIISKSGRKTDLYPAMSDRIFMYLVNFEIIGKNSLVLPNYLADLHPTNN